MSKFRIAVQFIPQILGSGTGYGRPQTLEQGSVRVPAPPLAAMQWTLAEQYHSLFHYTLQGENIRMQENLV